ncbi:CATRA system-associated protein [Streptomyces europaeiscabiei]|uniref:CATRA system-associated protein n=1 Tax=Streptomyces europaeiscabiei TaxID=146819 RepID=UPI0038F6E1CB
MTGRQMIDDETRTDVLDVLGDLLEWRLSPQRWDRVQALVDALADALTAGDGDGVRDVTAELELSGPVRITRIGADPVIPAPLHTRDQANHLVHALSGPTPQDAASGAGTIAPGGGDDHGPGQDSR